MRALLLAALAALACLLPATAGAATLHATPSTLTSVYNGAVGGDTILLAAGSYGEFNGGVETSTITLKPETGAAVSIAGGTFSGAKNVTVQGVKYTQPVGVVGVSTNINFDGDTFDGLPTGANEGRLGYLNGSTGTVSNSHFGGGGCSDGIQLSGGGGTAPTVTITGNEFTGIMQGNCSAHVDPIQLYGGKATVTDNYFHGNSTGIMSPDGNGSPLVVTNNVFVGTGYAWAIVNGGGRNDVIRHNVVQGWTIEVGQSNAGTNSSNETVTDNVAGVDILSPQPSSGVIQNHNITNATFVGGTGRCAYALAAGSPGKGAASDGTDIGLNDCGAPPPPVDTTPPATSITQQPIDSTATSATVAFTADEPSTFDCSLDSAPFASCTSPVALSGLTIGGHVFSVRARDTAGNLDATPATASWTVTAQPPPPVCDQACKDALQAQIDTLTSQVTALTSQVATAQADRAAALAARDAAQAQVTTLTAQVADLQAQLAAALNHPAPTCADVPVCVAARQALANLLAG